MSLSNEERRDALFFERYPPLYIYEPAIRAFREALYSDETSCTIRILNLAKAEFAATGLVGCAASIGLGAKLICSLTEIVPPYAPLHLLKFSIFTTAGSVLLYHSADWLIQHLRRNQLNVDQMEV